MSEIYFTDLILDRTVESECKYKVAPVICHEGIGGEQNFRSILSLTTALDGDGWSTPRLGGFTPGMTWYPLYRRRGGFQDKS